MQLCTPRWWTTEALNIQDLMRYNIIVVLTNFAHFVGLHCVNCYQRYDDSSVRRPAMFWRENFIYT